jgi:uncharacterized membrane protein
MKKFRDADMPLLIGLVLRAGVVISISIVFLGGILYLYRHGHSVADYNKFKGIPEFVQYAAGLFNGAVNFKGQAIIQIGIMLLIVTPVLRIIFSTIGFVLEKDYMYVGISLLVLFIIFASALSGHAG